MKKIILAISALLILVGCTANGGKKADFDTTPIVGHDAKDFLYNDMDNRPFRLSEKKGNVVMIFFWRMKCPDCKVEMKSLDALARKYKDKGLIVVAVGADAINSAPISEVVAFLKKNHYDSWVDLRDDDGFVSEAYGVIIAPETVVVDKSGKVAAVEHGKADWTSPEKIKLIESLLKG